MPANFMYIPEIRAGYYLRLPRADDLSEGFRLNERLFR